jgi:hypothetical protein
MTPSGETVSVCAACRRPVEVATLAYNDGPHWVISCRNDECRVGIINVREAEFLIQVEPR